MCCLQVKLDQLGALEVQEDKVHKVNGDQLDQVDKLVYQEKLAVPEQSGGRVQLVKEGYQDQLEHLVYLVALEGVDQSVLLVCQCYLNT